MEVSQVNVVEEQAPVPEIKNTKKPFKSGYVVGLLLFLVVCLIGGLTYFVLKERGIDLLVKDVEDNDIEAQQMCTTGSEQGSCEVALDNKGWALFSVPDYEFSVEVPSYRMTQKIGYAYPEDIDSVWKASFGKQPSSLYLDNYVKTVNLAFYPLEIRDMGCGQGCVKEHDITVNIYENKESKDLTAIKDVYTANWTKDVPADEGNMSGEIVSKWDMNVWDFTQEMIGGSVKGYLVVTDSYVYEVKYFFSTDPSASYQIALKVLDSMKFEKSSDTSVSVVYMGEGGDISKKFVDYVYFLESATKRAFLVDKNDVILNESKRGKTFLLTYAVATSDTTVGDTSYWIVSGTFTYVQQ